METVQIYAPKRDAKIRIGTNPFSSRLLQVSGRMNFNKEVNTEKLVVPINFTKDLLNYSNSITGIYISINPGHSIQNIQEKINEKLGANYSVKTNAEKNELIFKTSKTEKIIVLILLLFIFILAAFNLIASITVLFIEKKGNIQTMIGFGANQKTLFSIFLWEGVLIAGKGILYGLIIGYGICVLQLQTGILTMPNSNGEAFPILLKWADALTIIGSVSLIGFLFSYIPVYVLLKKNFGHLNY
jgi:lipoprotein-releasing system permease protein